MIYIIGNTLFGYPKMIDIQINYFKNWIIPYLKRVHKEGDILIHTGNIFYNKQTVNLKVLNDVLAVFDTLCDIIQIFVLRGSNDDLSCNLISRNDKIKILNKTKKIKNIMFFPTDEFLMPDNDTDFVFYHTPLKNLTGVKRSFNGFFENENGTDININVSSPYQLNKDYSTSQHGFFEFDLKNNKINFVENTYSPSFRDIYINDISELSNITKSKDFVNLIIDSNVIEKKENKNKLDIFLSKSNINNVYYIENNMEEKITEININNDIRNILIDNADDETTDNLKEIFKIYDNTKNN